MRKIFFTIFLMLFAGNVFSTVQTTDYLEAKKLSEQHNKPILIDFMTDWWGSCKTFAREAETDDEVNSILNSVVLLKIDCEKGEGPELKKTFSVPGYPTFVLTNSKGETLYRWIGYEKSYFLTSLNTGLNDLTTIEQKMNRFNETPDENTANILASYFDSKGEYKDAANYYTKASKLNSDKKKDYYYKIFQAHYWSVKNQRK